MTQPKKQPISNESHSSWCLTDQHNSLDQRNVGHPLRHQSVVRAALIAAPEYDYELPNEIWRVKDTKARQVAGISRDPAAEKVDNTPQANERLLPADCEKAQKRARYFPP